MEPYKSPQEILNNHGDEWFLILVFKYLDQNISAAENEELKKRLQEDECSRDLFVALLIQFQQIRESVKENNANFDLLYNPSETQIMSEMEAFEVEDCNLALRCMAQEEKKSPAIEIPHEPMQRELIQKVIYPPHEKAKISKFSIFTLIVSVAAVLFFILFIKYVPETQYSVDVATLADQMNVHWAPSETGLKTGSRLWTNAGPLDLKSGIVKLRYDDGVDVVIEGPAFFEIERLGIYLEYGRLYSQVSEAGLGFTVTTPTSQFIDHGTEFGVQADVNGSSELHVIKGKVQLFAGLKGKNKTGQMITKNHAVRYNANREQIRAIPMENCAFARNINSDTGIIWRGQMEIGLADIVSGGNGLMTTVQPEIIAPNNRAVPSDADDDNRFGDFTYHTIENNFVDGTFVPSLEKGAPKVTSVGHKFKDCPSTNNETWAGIFNTSYYQEFFDAYPERFRAGKGIFFREAEAIGKRSLFMHSNVGITFDLNRIRAVHSHRPIKNFHSGFLVNQSSKQRMLDFWILIDGQVRHQKTDIKGTDAIIPIQVPISDQDQFLSLVVTDGSDDDSGYCWGFFIEPILVLEGE